MASSMTSILSTAAAGGIRAAEQVQGTAISAETGQTASATRRAESATGTLNETTAQLGQAAAQMTSSMSSSQQAALRRQLNVLAIAEDQLSNGIGRVIASNAGPTLGPPLQGAFDSFSAGLAQVRNSFSSSGGPENPGIYSNPISTLSIPETHIAPAAVGAQPHLLIMTSDSGESFYFGISTAAYDTLRRTTRYGIAAQERLQRQDAQQAVSVGSETISLSGAVFAKLYAGARHIDSLRRIGAQLLPLTLTTGYGDVLGRWQLTQIEEDQSFLMPDGAPRKQSFSLEFVRYGNDSTYQ